MVTEEQILHYQSNPDSTYPEIVEAIKNGDIMLISKDRQAQIIARINELYADNKLLVTSISQLLKSCEGIAETAPEALDLAAKLKILNKKGEFEFSALLKLGSEFMMGTATSHKIKDIGSRLSAGFDKETFMSVPFNELLESLKAKGLKFDTYTKMAEMMAKNQLS